MTDLAIVLGLILFLICLTFVVVHSMRIGRLTLLDWSILAIGGVYGVGWSLIVIVTRAGGNPSWEQWLLPNQQYFPIHTALALVLIMAIWFGWVLLSVLPFVHRRPVITSRNSNSEHCRLIAAMWILLAISFVMQWLYAQAYGGLIGLLDYSSTIRSGIFHIDNQLSFLKPFGGLALFASFGFFGLLLSRVRRFLVVLGLLLSVLFSIYVLYSWLGRIGFLTYLATFVLGFLLFKRPRPFVLLFRGGVVMLTILVGAYCLSAALNLKAADNLIVFLAKELSFPFGSFFAQLASGEHLFRCLKDILVAPVYFLPSSIWSDWIENVGQVNTAVIMGAPKGEQGVTGAIPVDLLTLGLMQFSVVGIPIVGVLFGALLRFIQQLLDRLSNPGLRAVLEAYIVIKIAVLGVFYAHPPLLISGSFALIVSVLIMVFCLKTPKVWWRDAGWRKPLHRTHREGEGYCLPTSGIGELSVERKHK